MALHWSHRRIYVGVRVALLAAMAVVGLSLLACGSSSGTRADVQPIDDIIDTPIEVTDVSGSSAVVRATTSVDVVCSVVYGTDTGYGGQSTDLDMAGTGHSDHAAILRGLQPDTLYHYRLQGTGPDGTIYVSDDMTFTTAAESDPLAGRTNLAGLDAGASVVEASSQFDDSGAWQPQNAIDGDPNTEWSSAGDGDGAFITIELAERQEIGAVGLWTRTMGSSAQIASFRVITDDGTRLGPFDIPDGAQMYVFPVTATAKQLRFEVVSSSGGNTGIVELAVLSPE